MLGAIAGDIIGSPFEQAPIKTTEFPLFGPRSAYTDDTVLTVAVADALLGDGDFARALRDYAARYPDRGYGPGFRAWLASPPHAPAFSRGNGSAMRVSPVAWAFDSLDDVLEAAGRSAAVSHDDPDAIAGARAVAACVFLARSGADRRAIREFVASTFAYDLGRTLDAVRPGYGFDGGCPGSVPEAILCFLESRDVESAIRNAVSLGGDSDTMACIAGAIGEAFYGGLPAHLAVEANARLPADFRSVIDRFRGEFMLVLQ